MTFCFFQVFQFLLAIMPRTYVKKGVITMDREDLEKAFNHRVETGCSIRVAATQFALSSVSVWASSDRSRFRPPTTLMVGYAT